MSHLKTEDYLRKAGLTVSGFTLGIISHGALDYAPQCYPINSKVDFLTGLVIMLLAIFIVKKEWKLIVTFILFGCVFPDVVDLLPGILNSQLGIGLPTFKNVFPWHLPEYSGSLYNSECSASRINHLLIVLYCGICIFLNKNSLRELFRK